MKINHLFEYIVFQSFAFCIRLLPHRYVRRLGSAIGIMVYSLIGYRRSVTLNNIRKAFPEKSEEEVQQIARGAYRNVGITLFELIALATMDEQDIHNLVVFENPEVILNAYRKGKGLLILAAHFGNWEMLAQSLVVILKIPMKGIVKIQSNRLIDEEVNRRRTRFGNTVVGMEQSVREVLRTLKEGGAVGIVADQAAPKENIQVTFFGRSVPTHIGPAVFCLKTRAPLIATMIYRQRDGRYSVVAEEVPSQDLQEYSDDNVATLTRRHVALTESYIRRQPDQWMWMHKRWKHVDEQSGKDA